ncbi:2-oxo acid dehydrogenase subunit E2 [Nocardia violaceofusca]|uniref:2-oxo acid dehydrogenase subunit E2 n=1 Tax=Nocardia violaceofusca TaxID=941182 RepID=UPI0007A49887|nr:2-oxo acid dehydrogenase subunit E2 [Nocardia violaceofusca]
MTTDQAVGDPVTLQSLGDNISEATVTRWLKSPGDRVEVDEPLLEVATDKVDTEILAPVAGTLIEILAAEDEVVAVGGNLAIIGRAHTEASSAANQVAAPEQPPTSHGEVVDANIEVGEQSAPSAPDPTPGTINLGADTQREPHEASDADSQPAPSAKSAGPMTASDIGAQDRVERLPRIRQTIARRMLESLQTSAQLTTVVEADVTRIANLRASQKDEFHRRTEAKLSFLPFFTKAAVEALADHPVINASVNADCTEVTYHAAVHLGMAVDSPNGLMVPVIRNAQKLTVSALARTIAENADLVRSGKISPDALSGGTFTITNTGSRGALFDTPIINQPQSAILGIGSVVERVVPQRDPSGAMTFGARSMAYLSISYDHRIIDGADAARFLATVRRRLETGFTAEELS